MTLFRRPVEARAQATTWGDWAGDPPAGAESWSGASVTTSSALQLLTVYGCVNAIANSISTLPVDCYTEKSDGTRSPVTPPGWLLEPQTDLDLATFLGQTLTSLLLAGNAFWVVERGQAGTIAGLRCVDPSGYFVRRESGRKVVYFQGVPSPLEVVHLPGLVFAGNEMGMSPVEAARQTIGAGLTQQEFGARFFAQGSFTSGVIEVPGPLDPQVAARYAKDWSRLHSGRNKWHLPGVLEGGASWKPTAVTPEQAQFLATRQYTALEIVTNMFQMDASDMSIPVTGRNLTYANLEQYNIRFTQRALLPWVFRLEKAISRILPKPRFVKLNVNALLRADTATRFATYQVGIANQIYTADYVSNLEDIPASGRPDRSAPPVGGVDGQSPAA